MKTSAFLILTLSSFLFFTSCISKKEYEALQMERDVANEQLAKSGRDIARLTNKLKGCEQDLANLNTRLEGKGDLSNLQKGQIEDLKEQIADLRKLRDQQLTQVGDLTVLSQSANENIKETLGQLEDRDKYIRFIQAAKTKADSVNLALAINLKGVLKDGIEDQDVEVIVDKTVVFINISDKMLYQSGSSTVTPRAGEVLGKIAKIIQSRPEFEVMVEGYTDNIAISSSCMKDNWDLSVMRATSVVRALQKNYGVDPNRLIAAGRGEYNALRENDTAEGRSANRRTRIIIMPKLNQFYDLLNPELAEGEKK